MKKLYILIILLCLSAHAQLPQEIKITGGKISGVTNNDISIYKGIPFAAPPVGNLRWKAPQPVKPWRGVRECIAFGASPMQGEPVPFSMWSQEFLIPKSPISEDCLYLNVWSGTTAPTEKRPVLVWIYGGGFAGGGSGVPIYDGAALAQKGIVVVSFNYRVGLFGFMAHPELSKESGHKASGNYGLLDQVAALKWVQQNIAAFGGDPANVTIAGQSAGGMSVTYLIGSPLAKGLFNKAIAQSGSGFFREQPALAEAEKQGAELAEKLGAKNMADLRKLSSKQILDAQGGIRRPVIDGYVLPSGLAETFTANKENPVTLLTGWNENEDLFWGEFKDAAGFTQQIENEYKNNAQKLLTLYPANNDVEAEQAQLDLSRDRQFGIPEYSLIKAQLQRGTAYVYRFTHVVPATGEYLKYRASHTGEVPYTFNNLGTVDRPWADADYTLADTMSNYWVNFIKTGNPNGNRLTQWPAYTDKQSMIMEFDINPEAKPLPDKARLDFLQAMMEKE
ncbi:carboxylesterase/lipase family protein [Flavobacterium psychrotrophum]|uniref:carboxylesterase/lipase family protein n=1 Tax=Flavobacterium psychrotrophum TaxID=2294119 RepID=UPI000E3174F6|nr:carboxylesterase family protein [Flavobacterium psychrotrophum]